MVHALRRGVTGVCTLGAVGLAYDQGELALSILQRAAKDVIYYINGPTASKPIVQMVHGDSDFCQSVLQDGQLERTFMSYKPSWFYFHPVFGTLASAVLCR